MEEEIQLVIEDAKENMEAPIEHLKSELSKLRAGKASPAMLESVMVDYYGSMTPLSQVANINTPDGRTLVVQPWEKGMIGAIEKGIMQANLGLNPANDGTLIRIPIPALTEERRKELSKQVKNEGENAKVSIRTARKNANDNIKQLKKDGLAEDQAKGAEEEIQKITDAYSAKVDEIIKAKEVDIMKV